MAKSKKSNHWYFSLSKTLKLIIAIIPFTSWIVHALVRITSKNTLAIILGIISLFGFGLIMWIIDLVCIATGNKLILT